MGDTLISVVIPSRNRWTYLVRTVNSLLSTSIDPSSIEILIKLDSDDKDSIIHIDEINAKYLIYSRGAGYADIYKFYNDLCSIATGKWIFIFNDDAIMLTTGWDKIILQINKQICLVNPYTPTGVPTGDFPFITKKAIDILGHCSLSPHCDSWLQSVFAAVDATINIPDICIKHENSIMMDKTRQESLSMLNVTSAMHSTEAMDILRKHDIDKLKPYII